MSYLSLTPNRPHALQAVYRRHHTLPVRAFNRLRISARSAFPLVPEALAGTPCFAVHEMGNFRAPFCAVEFCDCARFTLLQVEQAPAGLQPVFQQLNDLDDLMRAHTQGKRGARSIQ